MTVVTFGAFSSGSMSEFEDTSQNGFAPWVTILPSDWVGGKYKARFTNWDAAQGWVPTILGDPANYRVHPLGNSQITSAFLQEGNTFYRTFSCRWASTAFTLYAGDEIHSDLPIVAPFHGADTHDGAWNWTTDGGSPAVRHIYGGRSSADFDWQGLTSDVVVDEWLHTLCAVTLADNAGAGRFTLWACHHGDQMVNVVPTQSVPTQYPNDSLWPMMSLYYLVDGNVRVLEYAAGCYASTLSEARTWQIAEVGYDMWGGGGSDTTAPTVPTGLAVTSTVPTSATLIWNASTDASGVAGYKVYRGGVQVATASASPYTDTGLTAGTNYSFTVAAYDTYGNTSAQSGAVSVTTPSTPSGYDTVPSGWMGGSYVVTGADQHGSQADKQRCYRVAVTQSGTVTHIGHYREPQAVGGTELTKLAVWPDNGSGTDPSTGAILGQTAEVSFTQASATGRYSTALTAPFAVTEGDIVWVGELVGGQGNIAYVRSNTVAGVFRLMSRTYASGLVAWSPSTDSVFDLDMTVWLEGTASAPTYPAVYQSSFVTTSELTLIYDVSLSASYVPLGADFAVTVGGVARQVTQVAVSGTVVTLTLASPVLAGEAVVLSYTQATGRELQTSAADKSANLSSESVTNNTASTTLRVTTIARVVGSGRTGDGVRVVGGLGGGV